MIAESGNQLPDSLAGSAAALERNFESVRAVTAGEENRFSRALHGLRELAHSEQIALAIIGDLGAIRYGYPIAAQTIDIVVAQDHLARLVEAAPRCGFSITRESPTGWHTLAYGDVLINVIPAEDRMRVKAPTTIPVPAQLGVLPGLDFASLPGWLELKLSSARQVDFAQVVEVMKQTSAELLQQARSHFAAVHSSYLQRFDHLQSVAQEERIQEAERGRRVRIPLLYSPQPE